MRPVTMPTLGSVTVTNPCPLDYRAGNPQVSIQLIITGTNTSTVQVTDDDIWAPTYVAADGNWFSCPVAALVGATASQIATMSGLFTAVRLNMTAWTSGGATLKIVPASNIGA